MAEPTSPPDPLAELRERIRATQDATERLAAEAAGAARAHTEGRPPPQGWRTPHDTSETAEEIRALATVLDTLRSLVPPELQQQLSEVIRQVLLLLRALIDWWVDRLEPGEQAASARGREPVVEDIPVA
jgi:hypothetical protein